MRAWALILFLISMTGMASRCKAQNEEYEVEIVQVGTDGGGNWVEGRWTNTSGRVIYIQRASIYVMSLYGAVADMTGSLVRARDGAMLVFLGWDHYQSVASAEGQWVRHLYGPGHAMVLQPWDQLVLGFKAVGYFFSPNIYPGAQAWQMQAGAAAFIDYTLTP